MGRSPTIARSIILSVIGYYALECAVWSAFRVASPAQGFALYGLYLVSGLFHVAMAAFLLWRAGDFRLAADGHALDRVNLPCHLTLLRASAAPTVVFLIPAVRATSAGVALVVVVALVFATDFVDGRIARRRGQVTVIGGYLDSSTDYVILLGLSVGSVILGLMPVWYFAVLAGRLLLFSLAQGVVALLRGRVEAETTFLGKVAVFAAMATFAFQLARFLRLPGIGHPTLVLAAEIACTVLLGVSVADKAAYVARKLREPRGEGGTPGPR